jgi:hypothetical protein
VIEVGAQLHASVLLLKKKVAGVHCMGRSLNTGGWGGGGRGVRQAQK